MTTRLTALRLVLLALLAGCDWGTKPGLPNNVGNDAAADVAWADTAPPPYDAVVTEDVPPPPDVPEPADAPVATPDVAAGRIVSMRCLGHDGARLLARREGPDHSAAAGRPGSS
jgi:hypothetical protein